MSKHRDFEDETVLGKRPRGSEDDRVLLRNIAGEQNGHDVERTHTNGEVEEDDDESRQETKALEEFQRPPPSKITRYQQEVEEEEHHLHHAHLSEVGQHLLNGNHAEGDDNEAESQRYFHHQQHHNLEYLQMLRDQEHQHHSLQGVATDDDEDEDEHHRHHHQHQHLHHRQDLHHPLHLQHQHHHLQQHGDEDEEAAQRHEDHLQALHLLQQHHHHQQQNHQDHINPSSPHDYHLLQPPLVHPHHHHHHLHQTEKGLTGHLSYPHMEELDPNAYPPHPEELHLSHTLQNTKDLPLHLHHLHHLHQAQDHQQHELQLQHQMQEEEQHHRQQHEHQTYQHQGTEQEHALHHQQQQQQQQEEQQRMLEENHIGQYPILSMPLSLPSLVGSKIPLHSLPSFSSARLTPRTTKAKLGRPPKSKNKQPPPLPPPELVPGDVLHDPTSSSHPTNKPPSSDTLQSSDLSGIVSSAVSGPSPKRGPKKKTKDPSLPTTKQKKNRATFSEEVGAMLRMHLDMQLAPQTSLDQTTAVPAPQPNTQDQTADQETQTATKDTEESPKESSLILPPLTAYKDSQNLPGSTPSKRKAVDRSKNNDGENEDADEDDDGGPEEGGDEEADGTLDDVRKYNFQVQWEAKYQELVDYKLKYGHTNVPREWKENKTLGVWVRTQRRQRKSGKLSDIRAAKLEEIEFSWHAPRPPTWEETFEELKTFKEENGHCCVPRFFPPNQKLAAWVQTQRRFRKTSRLRPSREALLNGLGFIWESKRYVGYVPDSPPPASDPSSTSPSMTAGSLSKDLGAQDAEMMRHQEMMNHFQHIQDLQNAHEIAQHLSNQRRVQRLRATDPNSSHIPAHIVALISSPSSFSSLSGSSLPSLLVSSLCSSSSKKDAKDEQTSGFYRPEDAEMESERALGLSLHTTQNEGNNEQRHHNGSVPSRPSDRELLKDL